MARTAYRQEKGRVICIASSSVFMMDVRSRFGSMDTFGDAHFAVWVLLEIRFALLSIYTKLFAFLF